MKKLIKILAVLSYVNVAYALCLSGEDFEKALGIQNKIFLNSGQKAEKVRKILFEENIMPFNGVDYKIVGENGAFIPSENVPASVDDSMITVAGGQSDTVNLISYNSEYYAGQTDEHGRPVVLESKESELSQGCRYSSFNLELLRGSGDRCTYKIMASHYVSKAQTHFFEVCSKKNVNFLYTQKREGTLRFEKVS